MGPAGTGRMLVAIAVLLFVAGLAWRTMEPGKAQQLTWLLLGFFALRVVLGWLRSRRIVEGSLPAERTDSTFEG
jgi:Flp pilus assembly protein TadB